MNKIFVTAGLGLALVFANLSFANVIVNVTPTAVLQVGGTFNGDYLYTYAVQLDGHQEFLDNGRVDAYCISHINGFVGVPTFSATGYSENTGMSGGCGAATDPLNAGVTNPNIGAYVEIIYTGTAVVGPNSVLPSLQFYSIYPASTLTSNIPVGARADNVADGTSTANQADVQGPVNPTPEPATMTLFGSALLGIGYFARKRSKS